MEIFNQIQPKLITKGSAVALGMFDGVHIGHSEIISNAVRHAKKNNSTSVVATFINHPHTEITGQAPKLLSTFEERMELIEKLNVENVLALEFDSKLRHMSAQDYFTKVLIECLNSKYISVGFDHKFGFNQEGNPEKLKEWGKKFGVAITVHEPVNVHDEPISSTRIRKNLAAGKVKMTSLLLGRYYSLSGQVTQGLKRGTELGFPTANLMPPSNRVIPGIGVYVGRLSITNENIKELPCVINVGHCPTFKEDTSELKVEAHILDFKYRELYKNTIKIEFIDRLRDEIKFSSKEDLIDQIKRDCKEARKILSTV
ncbi:MAG: bifunctional riboflavin kinase/FAD synthetase [Candidatus Melainabacteria bacterium]|nr:bifunctional riboflavin kinase/FAD synthetase [Candidatus Melainabacteria bacterium]MBI3308798.1 bifunctional riboflavin kinase/FAD synthetase [Candidatus Melainabacteria bacterium]